MTPQERRDTLRRIFFEGATAARKNGWHDLRQVLSANPYKRYSPAYWAFCNGARVQILGARSEVPLGLTTKRKARATKHGLQHLTSNSTNETLSNEYPGCQPRSHYLRLTGHN